MDLLLILIIGAGIATAAWFGWLTGRDSASRLYQSELASQRAKVRRLQRDLEMAYEETAMVRRAGGQK